MDTFPRYDHVKWNYDNNIMGLHLNRYVDGHPHLCYVSVLTVTYMYYVTVTVHEKTMHRCTDKQFLS